MKRIEYGIYLLEEAVRQQAALLRRIESLLEPAEVRALVDGCPPVRLAGLEDAPDVELLAVALPLQVASLENRMIRAALDVTRSNGRRAAELLGIEYKTMRRRMQTFGIAGPRTSPPVGAEALQGARCEALRGSCGGGVEP